MQEKLGNSQKKKNLIYKTSKNIHRTLKAQENNLIFKNSPKILTDRHLTKKDIQIANKHVKRWPNHMQYCQGNAN